MNEFALIERLIAGLPVQAEGLMCGIGDDCAVIAGDGRRDWLITTEHCIEGVHFRPEWAPWRQIGRKAVLAAMSDVSAMGGRPRFLVVALAVPHTMPITDLEAFYAGIRSVAQETGMVVVGGDMAQSRDTFCSTLTVIGDVIHGRAIYRRGARPGDGVYVTGACGGAAFGLHLLRQQTTDRHHPCIARQFEPPSRVSSGQWLASTGCISAMIDISDGLLSDLGHVARISNVGMRLDGRRIPIHSAMALGGDDGADVDLLAWTGGEDYELAFTVAGVREAAFAPLIAAAGRTLGHPITRIGEVVTGTGIVVLDAAGNTVTVGKPGFVHEVGESET